MTTVEACQLLHERTLELQRARAAAEFYRLFTVRLAFHSADLAKQLDAERRRRLALLDERRAERKVAA